MKRYSNLYHIYTLKEVDIMSQNIDLITLNPYTGEDAVEVKCFGCGDTVKVSPDVAAKIDGKNANGICLACLAKSTTAAVSEATKEAADTIKTALGN